MAGEAGMLILISASNTYVQTNVEEHMRGRVISYFVMGFFGDAAYRKSYSRAACPYNQRPFTLLIEGAAVIVSILLFIPSFKKTGKRAERKEKRLKKSSAKSMPS